MNLENPARSTRRLYTDAAARELGIIPIGSVTLVELTDGIASAEALGAPTLTPGPVTISLAAGIASAEALGAPVVSPGPVTIALADGIASGEAFGTPVFTGGIPAPSGGGGPRRIGISISVGL